jgi:hypothetical protein
VVWEIDQEVQQELTELLIVVMVVKVYVVVDQDQDLLELVEVV